MVELTGAVLSRGLRAGWEGAVWTWVVGEYVLRVIGDGPHRFKSIPPWAPLYQCD